MVFLLELGSEELLDPLTVSIPPSLLSDSHCFLYLCEFFVESSYFFLLQIHELLQVLVLLSHFCCFALSLKGLDSHVLDLVNHFGDLAIQLRFRSIFKLVLVFSPGFGLNLKIVFLQLDLVVN